MPADAGAGKQENGLGGSVSLGNVLRVDASLLCVWGAVSKVQERRSRFRRDTQPSVLERVARTRQGTKKGSAMSHSDES